MRKRKLFVTVLFCAQVLCLAPGDGFSANFAGKKARDYIGTLEEKLMSRPYYCVLLERRNRLPAKDFNDAIIFTPLASGFRLIRRQDEDYRLLLNVADGDGRAPQVTRSDVARYRKIITADAMKPVVIVNKQGQELAIVYCALTPCYIYTDQRKDGAVSVELKGSMYDGQRDELILFPFPDKQK